MNTNVRFLELPPEQVAPRLLGCILTRELNGQTLSGRIVEVEAYGATDAASHSFRGPTPRSEVMFGPPGRLYVYVSYGLHYCLNIVTGPEGEGAAVLIRALEPLKGIASMEVNRQQTAVHQLTNGPGKIGQALGIDKTWNGHNLQDEPLRLVMHPPLPASAIVQTTRVGITQAVDVPWRYYIRDNPFISRR